MAVLLLHPIRLDPLPLSSRPLPTCQCVCIGECLGRSVCLCSAEPLTYGATIALQHMDGRFLTIDSAGCVKLRAAVEPRWEARGVLPFRDRKDGNSARYLFPVRCKHTLHILHTHTHTLRIPDTLSTYMTHATHT